MLFAAALGIGGCTTAVANDLPESEANRAVVALEVHGVSAEKERDPETEGRFRVTVGRDEAAVAAGVLSQEAVPARENPGILQSLGSGSMVPSRLSEHARLLSGISGELERSLQAVDGVVSARVHLAAPEHSPLDEAEPSKPSASVLIRHRGASPPLAVSDVQRLVAGAVPGLAAGDDHGDTRFTVAAALGGSRRRSPQFGASYRSFAALGQGAAHRGRAWPDAHRG
jgi:type III secretion protein J